MTLQESFSGRFESSFSLQRMILLSVFFHAVILVVLFFTSSSPSPKWTFGPVYSVQLVSFSENSLMRENTSASAGTFGQGIPPARLSVLKKQLDAVSSAPIRKAEIQKQDFSGVEKAVEKIRQSLASERATTSTQNQLGDAEITMRMKIYYAAVWTRIKNQWVLPQSIMPRENIGAVVHIKVFRDGSVADLGFEKRSGNRYFDDSAIKAVRKASPLPALPEWVRDNSIELGIRFHSSELR